MTDQYAGNGDSRDHRIVGVILGEDFIDALKRMAADPNIIGSTIIGVLDKVADRQIDDLAAMQAVLELVSHPEGRAAFDAACLDYDRLKILVGLMFDVQRALVDVIIPQNEDDAVMKVVSLNTLTQARKLTGV